MTLKSLYGDVILEHYQHPENEHELAAADQTVEARNPVCGDELELYLEFSDDTIETAAFTGTGCAISQASVSLLTEHITGLSRAQARELAEHFVAMARGETDAEEEMGELKALEGVSELPDRIQCATLAWKALLAALDAEPGEAKIEYTDSTAPAR